jgi:GDPmannose 4,6-dehydratase
MGKKRALITGITGQDGSYLTELLLEKGYDVVGLIRRHSQFEEELGNVSHLEKDIILEYGDMTDVSSLENTIMKYNPHEVYNLAAQSHVRISFELPQYTLQVNALGVLNLLEAIRKHSPSTKFYQASTSEMFGNTTFTHLTEKTPMNPVSPYGTSKLCAHNFVNNYRDSYGLFAVSGILFNHESPRRGLNFVTNKVVNAAVNIWYGYQTELELGNLDAERDWGHAKDYVEAMWMMLQSHGPKDYVVATGKTHSVRYLCEYVFKKLDLDYTRYVRVNPKFLRPNELHYLRGDSSEIRYDLGWTPKYTFEQMLDEMIDHSKKELSIV